MSNNLILTILSFAILFFFQSCKKEGEIIDGYTDKFSYFQNDTFKLFINAKEEVKNYELEINDINGGYINKILCDIEPQNDPSELAYEKGFEYQLTVKGVIPKLKSGIYLFGNKIPFLVKPKKTPEIIILYSSNTENAYCNAGGKSIYSYNSKEEIPAAIVSFKRPISLPRHSTEFLKWISKTDKYDIGFICDKDFDAYSNIEKAKLIIIPGHSEYWTKKARKNFDKFIEAGNNALIVSGNTMWWQVRYNADQTQLICYKNSKRDTISEIEMKTINWTESMLNYPVINSIGLDFTYGGMGDSEDDGWDGFKIVNPSSPLLKGSGLKENDTIRLKSSEYDGTSLFFNGNVPMVNLDLKKQFYRYELIGYDLASRFGEKNRNGSWIIMQKTNKHGVVINTGSTDWCKAEGMEGEDSETVKSITLNMIDLLLQKDKNKLFTPRI